MSTWLSKLVSRGFDTDPERVDRVTLKDACVGMPVLLVVCWIAMIPLLPLVALFALFEFLAAIAFLVCVFAVSISGYGIFAGRGGWLTWLVFLGSLFVLLGYFVVFPLLKRHPSSKRIERWLP